MVSKDLTMGSDVGNIKLDTPDTTQRNLLCTLCLVHLA